MASPPAQGRATGATGTQSQAAPAGGESDGTGARLLGRARELRELRSDIERAGLHTLSGHPAPHSRVLLIAGRPGSGRTALAEEFVRQNADRWPDGVLRVRLSGPGGVPVPPEHTARDLLAALGAPRVPPGADDDELYEALRSALGERRALLLLDDVAQPEQLLDLLPDTRGCLIVAVSSGPLTGVPDVRPCTLGGLDRSAAVALLAGRAGSAPRITVDPRSAEALAEECGNLPTALVLTGSWLAARPNLSVADAAKRLRSLPGTDPLDRVFRLVHDALPRPAARILRLLTLAPAGCVDAQVASALAGCSASTAQGALEEFVHLGLLHVTGERQYALPRCLHPLLRAALAEAERPAEVLLARARMLERTVRQLQACRAVAEPEGSEACQRHAAMPRAFRFASAAQARDWLEARRPALLAAARLAAEEDGGELDTLARRLVSALARAFETHRTREEAEPELYRLHELVLGVAERGALRREHATALLNLGDIDAGAGRLTSALARYRAALDASRAADGGVEGQDGALAGRALESIAGTYEELGDQARAADWYGRALSLRLTRGEADAAARLHGRMGAAHAGAGRYDEALRAWRAAAVAFRRLRAPQAHARALGEAARMQEQAGHAREALRTCRQALEAARRAGDRRLEAELRLRLADAFERVGDVTAGRTHRVAAERLLYDADSAARDRDAGDRGRSADGGTARPGSPTSPE